MRYHHTLAIVLVTLAACDGTTGPTPIHPPPPPPSPGVIDGRWQLVYWIADTPGQPVRDFYALGGRLNLDIADGNVSGALVVPAGIAADSAVQIDMAGTILLGGDTVRFLQHEDTFVGRATWNIHPQALWIVGHGAGAMFFTVALTRSE